MGIERLETDTLVLQCFQTLTGVKFVITASPGTTELTTVLQQVYEIYSDYVLKVCAII
jgi:trafficking protein particle complex subunit 4